MVYLRTVIFILGRLVSAVNFLAKPIPIDLTKKPLNIGGLYANTSSIPAPFNPSIPLAYFNPLTLVTAQQALAAICATQVYPNGQFAMENVNLSYLQGTISETMLKLLQTPVIGVIGPSDFVRTQITAAFTTPNQTAQLELILESLLTQQTIQNPSFLQIVPIVRAEAEAIVATLKYFGWTLFSPLFDITTYGLAGLSQVTSLTTAAGITRTCGTTIDGAQNNLDQVLNEISECLATSQSSVVLLWMDYDLAQKCIGTFYRNQGNQKLIFLASDRWAHLISTYQFAQLGPRGENPGPNAFPIDYLQGTIAFTPYSVPPPQLQKCLASFPPTYVIPNLPPYFSRNFFEYSFGCSLDPASKLPICKTSTSIFRLPCRCNGSERLTPDVIVPFAGYAYDAVLLLQKAATQLQTKGIQQTTSAAMSAQVSLITLNGLENATGPISFEQNIRKGKNDKLQSFD